MNQVAEDKKPLVEPLADGLMGQLWRLMTEVFGYRWASAYGTSDQSGTWAKGLAGLTGDDLARGVRKVIELGMDWPPSMPEFRKLCLPSEADLGLPEFEQAYRAAARLDWTLHPAVYAAAKIVGTYKLRYDAESSTRPKFEKAWDSVVERIRRGEVLEQPVDVPRLERCERTRKDAGRAYVAKMRAILRGEVSA